MSQLVEYVKDQIWILEYPIRYGGMDLYARMTLIRLANGDLFIHDPCRIDKDTKQAIDALGAVKYIVAPGYYHHLYVKEFQQLYPQAETFICPGLERKRPDIDFDWILGNKTDHRWRGELEQVLVSGPRIIWEVAFYHIPSKTIILVDLLENIGDDYRHKAGPLLRFWWKVVFHMWNKPKAAPEYQLAWGDKSLVRKALKRILEWDAERVVLAHGEPIEGNINKRLRNAWATVLASN
jgi:hypothetical protein